MGNIELVEPDIFPVERVQKQLQKIFICQAFSVSEILRRFLTYVIQETLAGRSNTIKEYTIAVNVLNKPVSFKPQHDAIVRIHAGRLRRALNAYYKGEGNQDDIEISVPKGSYVPQFGKMRAVVKNMITGVNPLVLENPVNPVSIAIMPFKTFEINAARLAFTESLGMHLSAEFSKFEDISVISYYTTEQLTAINKGVRELKSLFGVHYVLSGNVQFETGRMRVDAQLTDCTTGNLIWTGLYHHNFSSSDYFEVSDEIVRVIIGALRNFNGPIISRGSKNITGFKSGRSFPVNAPSGLSVK